MQIISSNNSALVSPLSRSVSLVAFYSRRRRRPIRSLFALFVQHTHKRAGSEQREIERESERANEPKFARLAAFSPPSRAQHTRSALPPNAFRYCRAVMRANWLPASEFPPLRVRCWAGHWRNSRCAPALLPLATSAPPSSRLPHHHHHFQRAHAQHA